MSCCAAARVLTVAGLTRAGIRLPRPKSGRSSLSVGRTMAYEPPGCNALRMYAGER
jgi:hypothetical protein